MDEALGAAGTLGDLASGGRVIAVLSEDRVGGVDEGGAAAFAVARAWFGTDFDADGGLLRGCACVRTYNMIVPAVRSTAARPFDRSCAFQLP